MTAELVPAPVDWPIIDDAAFHGIAGEIIRDIEPETEADPVALLVDFLVCFGNAVNAAPHCRVGGAIHRARLYWTLVGNTSRGRKGQARAEIRPIFAKADPVWSNTRVVGGLSSGEGLIFAVRDASGDDPGESDKRLMVVEEEFSSPLKVAAREKSILSETIRRAWDTGDLRTMTRRDPLRATNAHVSILGHITRAELTAHLTELFVANGLANRFGFALVRQTRLLPAGGTFDEDRLSSHVRLVRTALDSARQTALVERTPAAADLWERIYRNVETRADDGIVGALTARAAAHMLRLQLVYALLDSSKSIDVQHVTAAYALWRYSDASVRHIYRASSGDRIADQLLVHLRKAGEEGLARSAMFNLFSRHIDSKRLEAAIQTLEDIGLAVSQKQGTGGRPALRTFISEQSEQSEEGLPSLSDLSLSSLSSQEGDDR